MIVWNNEEGVVRLCFDGDTLTPTIKTDDDLSLGFFASNTSAFIPVGGMEGWDNFPLTKDGHVKIASLSRQPKQIHRLVDYTSWHLERVTLSLGLGEDNTGAPVVCVLNTKGTPYRNGCLLRFIPAGLSACYGIDFPGAEKAGFIRDIYGKYALDIDLLSPEDDPGTEKESWMGTPYLTLLKEYKELLSTARALLEKCGEECLRRSTSECRECELTKDVERASRFLESLKPRE